MDLQAILGKVEADFHSRLSKKVLWRVPEIKKEFNDAIENVLIITYNRVIKDARRNNGT